MENRRIKVDGVASGNRLFQFSLQTLFWSLVFVLFFIEKERRFCPLGGLINSAGRVWFDANLLTDLCVDKKETGKSDDVLSCDSAIFGQNNKVPPLLVNSEE